LRGRATEGGVEARGNRPHCPGVIEPSKEIDREVLLPDLDFDQTSAAASESTPKSASDASGWRSAGSMPQILLMASCTRSSVSVIDPKASLAQ
jgi:hypothetical protein